MTGRLLYTIALSWLVLVSATRLRAMDAAPPTEYKVKAAFLLSFPKFVEWPAAAFAGDDAPLRLGVLGSPAMAAALEPSAGKTVAGRPIELHILPDFEAAPAVHVLFVGQGAEGHLDLTALDGLPILVVTEDPGSFQRAGVINFYLDRGKTRFEIRPWEARKRQLVLGSSLLRIAKLVED